MHNYRLKNEKFDCNVVVFYIIVQSNETLPEWLI